MNQKIVHKEYDTDEDYFYDTNEITYDQDQDFTENLMKFKRDTGKINYDTDKGYESKHGLIYFHGGT
ncbi:hypothetical protein DICPUDRAFT_153057 [Dictyostelium purpureum]|uniref:Uncharacterized protein n=1 Tax=Dictyostelium purpureum TaxID=5786 RepID=F0ZMY4_DICPU|nr:uncharacterized protein DICPUDRAFT_153057 [Dictyostelium purpureum]EGC34690.1 hypothetical protein DICPUDRAFT_153057 [Dictyostelium purpureum]|eukprot:XP_003288775.1 hypothetical protein DICPUDRAFT_153057 [Dictyostelium purpureum]